MQAKPPTLERDSPGPPESARTESGANRAPTGTGEPVEQLIDEIRRLRVLAEVADIVTRDLSLDLQLPRLIDLITESLGAERATLFLFDRDADELFSRVLSG